MPDKLTSPLPNSDDKIAEMADRMLDGQLPAAADWVDEDEDMGSLVHVMKQLDEALGSEQPEPNMARRIKANLVAEWRKSGPGARTVVSKSHWLGILTQLFTGVMKRHQVFALAMIAVVVVGLAALTLSPLSPNIVLPGTAEGNGDIFPAVLLIGLMVLGIFVWFARRRL